MRYVFSGGGTAGHINPAISVADKIKAIEPESEIVFIGNRNGMENKLVTLAGYPIWQIDVRGLKRSLSPDNLKAVFLAGKAVKDVKRMLRDFMPDAVIGTGGYVCYPVIKAASKMGIYTAIHESNAVPGLTVRMLKKRADSVFTGFPECVKLLGLGECIGNPLRSGFIAESREEARKALGISGKYKYLLVSFGGSLGAEAVNETALTVMKELTSKRSDVLHIHAYGKNGENFVRKFREMGLSRCDNIRVSEYIYDMPRWLSSADAVICRSGAMTLAEIAAAGAPSVLIPSPNVTGDHQYKNALAFSEAGAAYLADERSIGYKEKALRLVTELLTDSCKREKMREALVDVSRPDAAERMAMAIIERAKG